MNFILNNEPKSFVAVFAREHGPRACAMAFRVRDAGQAYEEALKRGVTKVAYHIGPMELNVPTLQVIGNSRLYLVDRYGPEGSICDVDFEPIAGATSASVGLTYADHQTHYVYQGNMDKWAEFYEDVFNFYKVR